MNTLQKYTVRTAQIYLAALIVIIAAMTMTACRTGPPPPPAEPLPTTQFVVIPTRQPAPPAAAMPNLADAVQKVRPAVVSITTYTTPDRSDTPGAATGVIIDEQGLVITNNHAIAGAQWIIITTDSGYQTTATIAGTDRLTDLALLRLVPSRPYPYVRIRANIPVRPGEWTAAIGNALALPGGPTVTVGVVSAVSRTVTAERGQPLYDLLQTDTSINPGNSGGPLINADGDMIGINTAIIRDQPGRPGQYQGIGFAISTNTVVQVAGHLAESGAVPWAWMGLFMDDLTPNTAANSGLTVRSGVLVTGIVADGPSAKAGILTDDVITAIDDTQTPTVNDLISTLRMDLQAGKDVTVHVRRQGLPQSISLTLGTRPAK